MILQCRSCSASSLVELNSEICIHFPGLKGVDVEPIFAFPKLTVCLDCGSVQSDLSAKELDNVKESTAKFVAVLSNGA
jgi:hypothetical protein